MNGQRGDPPGIELVFIYFDVVGVIRQTLAEASQAHAPRTGTLQRIFEIDADARHGCAAAPVFPASAALIAVSANEFLLLGFHVAETRNVNSIRAVAERHFVFVPRHDPARARAHVVIHQVVAEFPAAVSESIGKFRGGGIEQDARGLQRGGAQEKHASLVLSA